MKSCPKCAAKKKAVVPLKTVPLKAEDLLKTVDYQEHNVVSREIIRQKNGTVTVFAFDKGQGLSEHTAPFDALVQVLEGKAEIMIDRHPHILKSGEIIVMPEDHPHALKALTKFKMMLIMIKQ
jgi:quercetin dioxygenase-like cupin family protein